MLPFLGQGACAALEDGVALGDAVGTAGDVRAGISQYEQARMRRTGLLIRGSRQAAKVAMAKPGIARRLRNFAIGRVPDGTRLRRLDRYVAG
jgi:2-polyprenyl-6-methoxyphenol hydroxylase-like FAD-dependent oxidoreductase